MSITFRVNHERRELYTIAEGPVTLTEILSHLEEEREARGLGYAELIDASKATVNVSPRDVRILVDLLRELGNDGKLGPAAIGVGDELAFGMIRMLQTLLEDVAVIRPFRNFADAEAWFQSVRESDGVRRG